MYSHINLNYFTIIFNFKFFQFELLSENFSLKIFNTIRILNRASNV